MYLENVVLDAVDPQRLGRFWEAALGGETLTDERDGYETRLHHDGGPTLDLCLQRVPEPPSESAAKGSGKNRGNEFCLLAARG